VARGAIALSERHPLSVNRELVGPQIPRLLTGVRPGWFARMLERSEARYYARIGTPDTVVVLHVPPAEAVRRKIDEPADYVRARAELVWGTDWSGTAARIVDAGRPLEAVIADLQAIVWEAL
jgi:thymidylate kinase